MQLASFTHSSKHYFSPPLCFSKNLDPQTEVFSYYTLTVETFESALVVLSGY